MCVILNAPYGFAQVQKVTVSSVEGKAFVIRKGEQIPMAQNFRCRKKDIFILEAGAQVEMQVGEWTAWKILGKSQSLLKELDGRKIRLKLNFGDMVLSVAPPLENTAFEVETPSAVATASNAQFFSHVGPTRKYFTSTFAVGEGELNVQAKISKESFKLKKDEAIDIALDPGPSSPRAALVSEKDILLA
jgi:hypothetical protein